jgi:CarboxypepD_reg-like domain/TonB-dependent Receptor Plug Domain
MLFILSTPFPLLAGFPSSTVFKLQTSQTIRGTIIDKQSESPLIGAAVQVVGITPVLGSVANENGSFEIKNVPTGRHSIQVSFIGYNTITIPNIVVNAGKETILNLSLEESVTKLDAVVVSSKTEKGQTQNELATISARQFNVEEVQRYSGGRGDVSRLAANFAGVATNNDSRNDIVIRGNSPTGVLWRLEGIPIPNPNHFSTLGTTGGPVSALNPNMIRNSDFLTSAFPSEYGNATAGVFDIGLRQGNKEKMEYTAQLGAFTGMEAMIEGPLFKKNGGSFVIAYRHSFVELANAAGINIGTNSLPRYKDLTFNFDFGQTKLGKFSIFGLGANSDIDFLAKDVDSSDFFAEKGEDSYAKSRVGIIGVRHSFLIDKNTYIRTVVSASNAGNSFNTYEYLKNGERRHSLDIKDYITTYRFSSFINKKYNAKISMRTGFLIQNMGLDIKTQFRNDTSEIWRTTRENDNNLTLYEAYSQWQYKPSERLTFNAGVHGQYLSFNKKYAIEPRIALNYQLSPIQSVSLGYGLHNQTQPLPVLLNRTRITDFEYKETNKDLDFTRSQHFVLGYDVKPNANWHAKIEGYYQALDQVPVEGNSLPNGRKGSEFSVLNSGADFGFDTKSYLNNSGTGKNMGVELTVEKFFSAGWYMLATASVFDSKYKGSDGVERNTAFNSNYIANVLAGKEIKFGKNKQNAITFDTKITFAGGRFVTPIDLEKSKIAGEAVYDVDKAFSQRQDGYFRWDFKIGYTLNSSKRKFTQQFFLDFQNVTNNKNIFQQRFSKEQGKIYNVYQIGFFPDVLWRVQF